MKFSFDYSFPERRSEEKRFISLGHFKTFGAQRVELKSAALFNEYN